MKMRKKSWRYLMRHHKHMFVNYQNPTLLELFAASRCRVMLKSILEDSGEKQIISLLIRNCCTFLTRPIIQHANGIEESIIDRRNFGITFKTLMETGVAMRVPGHDLCRNAYIDYSNNRLRGHHFWNAIKTANQYCSDKNLPEKLHDLKRKIHAELRIGEDVSEQTYQAMPYHEKVEIARLVKKYAIGVMHFCYQVESRKLKESAKIKESSVETSPA